jgi:hypothetical protein
MSYLVKQQENTISKLLSLANEAALYHLHAQWRGGISFNWFQGGPGFNTQLLHFFNPFCFYFVSFYYMCYKKYLKIPKNIFICILPQKYQKYAISLSLFIYFS